LGDLFQTMLRFADAKQTDHTYILSGKHHLLHPDTMIEPYDVNLNLVSQAELMQWSEKVLEQLKETCDLENDKFYILTNEIYRRHLTPYIVNYQIPMHID